MCPDSPHGVVSVKASQPPGATTPHGAPPAGEPTRAFPEYCSGLGHILSTWLTLSLQSLLEVGLVTAWHKAPVTTHRVRPSSGQIH